MEKVNIEIGTEMFEGECYTTITCTDPIKKKYLTQADIDRPVPRQKPGMFESWIEVILIILVLGAAVGGFWGFMLLLSLK